jgi:hypothetical protein
MSKKNADKTNQGAIERIQEMEAILDRATRVMDELESKLAEFEALQPDIKKLEKYYTGKAWKSDFKLDEEGKLPKDLKRGVLSEDGIDNLLERNKTVLGGYSSDICS